jgi:hypothetical protein
MPNQVPEQLLNGNTRATVAVALPAGTHWLLGPTSCPDRNPGVAVALPAGTHWLLGPTSCPDRNPGLAVALPAGTHWLLGPTSCPDRNPGVEPSSPQRTPLSRTPWALKPPRRRPPRDEQTCSSKASHRKRSDPKRDLSLRQPTYYGGHTITIPGPDHHRLSSADSRESLAARPARFGAAWARPGAMPPCIPGASGRTSCLVNH